MTISGYLFRTEPVVLEGGQKVVMLVVADRCDNAKGLYARLRDFAAVYVEPFEDGPKVGEMIWWQSRKVYFDQDRRSLTKVGASFKPET